MLNTDFYFTSGLYRRPVCSYITNIYEEKLSNELLKFDECDSVLTLKDYAEENPQKSYHIYYIEVKDGEVAGHPWSYPVYFKNPYTANNFIRWMYKNCPCLLNDNSVLECDIDAEEMYDDEWIIL